MIQSAKHARRELKVVGIFSGIVLRLIRFGNLLVFFFAAYGMVFSSFANFLWHLKFGLCLGNELLELVAMVAWSVWFSRNEARQGKARQQALAIVQKARLLLEEFHTANLKIP